MSTNFPTSLDSLTNPASGDTLATGHAAQHGNLNDAMEAVQARVGITGSADAASLTKRIAVLESAGGGAPVTACETITATSFGSYDRLQGWSQRALVSQTLFVNAFIAPVSITAATCSVYVDGTGTTSTSTTVGLYSLDAADNGTLIATGTGATTIFNTQGLKTFTYAVPVAITAGSRYAVGILQNGGSVAGLTGHPGSGNGTLKFLTPLVVGARASQTAQGNFTKAQLASEFLYFYFQISA